MTDAQSIIRAVNRAEEVHFILSGMSRTKRRSSDGGPASTAESPAPLAIELLDQAEDIRHSVIGWATVIHEEKHDPLPRDDVPAWTLWLRERAIWITSRPWAEDMRDELTDRTRRGIAMLGLFPRRTRLPEECQCGAPQWVYHEDIAWTLCSDGHIASLAEALPLDGPLLSCAEVAMILGVSTRTVERWVTDREIAVARTDPTRISTLAVKTKRVGLDQRAHVA